MKRRFFLLFALLALLAWGIFTLLTRKASYGPEIGSPAPNFSLQDHSGNLISLEDLKGKAVLVNFWATWCGPCRQEIPSLEALYQKFKDRGLVVVGISLDEDGWDSVLSFRKIVSVTFPIVLDRDLKASELYGTFRIPETYLIDFKGNVAGKFVGPQDYDQEFFHKKIESILPNL